MHDKLPKNFLRCGRDAFEASSFNKLQVESLTMNRKLTLLITATLFSMASFAQTVKEGIDKAAKDPATKENAAKADVKLLDKTIITNNSSNPAVQNSAIDKKKKHKKYKTKG
jgi:hypothetical protein